MLTEWTWSKYISCLDKKNCHLQGSIQISQILEWFFVRRDYDKPPAALLGRKRTLLALANPFYWFTVNIAICQRHLGKRKRRRVEKRCRKIELWEEQQQVTEWNFRIAFLFLWLIESRYLNRTSLGFFVFIGTDAHLITVLKTVSFIHFVCFLIFKAERG